MRALPAPLVAVLAALLALAGCASDADSGAVAEPETSLPAPLPTVQLEAFDGGEPVQLADQRGPLVVNLWASWCGPCRTELPILQEFSREYADRVDVLGIDFQDPQTEKAKEMIAEAGVTYPLLSDPDGALDRLAPFPHLRGLPFWAFVDAEGQVVAWEFIAVDDLAELEALVAEHLGVP